MIVKNLILTSVLALSLGACTYTINGKDMSMKGRDTKASYKGMKTVKNCYYSFLWFPPMNEDYLNIDKVAKDNRITSVTYAKNKVYPYVLFTRYCTIVKGK